MITVVIILLLATVSVKANIPRETETFSSTFTTKTGTEIKVSITFANTAKTGVVFPVNFTIEVLSLGEGIRDIHDIELGISIEAPGKLFSPYFYQVSKMNIVLDNETSSTCTVFYWTPDSFWMQLGPGQSVEVIIKFYVGFRENKPHAIDPHSEIGWQSCGTVRVEFYRDTTNYPLLVTLVVVPVVIIAIIVWKIRGKKKATAVAKKPVKEKETVIIREKVMVRCPYCGGLVEQGKKVCPHCGAKL